MATAKFIKTEAAANIYEIWQGEIFVGHASKCATSVCLHEAAESFTYRTMKELRTDVDQRHLPPPKKPSFPRLTMQQVVSKLGLSHNGLREKLNFARKFHPYLPKGAVGFFLVYDHFTTLVESWSDHPAWVELVKYPKRWLAENPLPFHVKQVDWSAFERTGRVVYLEE